MYRESFSRPLKTKKIRRVPNIGGNRADTRTCHGSLRGLQTATGRLENDSNTDAQASEHVDERVSAKQVDPTSQQVAYPRLGHTENLRHFGLCETSGGDQFLDLDHQIRSDKQVFGLAGRKTQITEDIAA